METLDVVQLVIFMMALIIGWTHLGVIARWVFKPRSVYGRVGVLCVLILSYGVFESYVWWANAY